MPGARQPRVAVLVVTWNRRDLVDRALSAIAAQDYPRDRMDVVVIDNASTDGTAEHLVRRWRPDAVYDNTTEQAHEPAFVARSRQGESAPAPGASAADAAPASLGSRHPFRSLALVRNAHNLGGCGGFNTGFAFVERFLVGAAVGAGGDGEERAAASANTTGIDFVWLADDDADFPPDALSQLVRAAATDPRIGLVGSRTVDIADRRTTIETTIYLDREKGSMGDAPPPGHPQRESHRRWVGQAGGTKGDRRFSGLRDVDIVSACSALARWSAVQKVGYWDWRYFIYCDDADWSLRFGRAGYRVVLNLDAVVYHTPWNLKLTPARIYYAQRNMVWTLQKVLPQAQLRRVVRRWMRILLMDALHASIHRRLFHADIIRRTARDIALGRAGRTGSDGPTPMPLMEALRCAGALEAGAGVAMILGHPGRGHDPILWARQVRAHVRERLGAGEAGTEPRWIDVVRNGVADAAAAAGLDADPEPGVARIIYGGRWPSRLRRQVTLLRHRPRAIVVFEQTSDFPAVWGRWTVHVDMKSPTAAQLERDGVRARLAFLGRWMGTAARCWLYGRTVRPYTSPTRYG